MLVQPILDTGEMCAMQEAIECGKVWKLESRTAVYILVHSTTAVTLVVRRCPPHYRHASECLALRLQRLQEDNG